MRDLQRFLANLREQIKMNNSLVYKQKKQQSAWLAQEKQEYIAADINFFGKRNGVRSQNPRRKRNTIAGPSEEPGSTIQTTDSDVYGLKDQKAAAFQTSMAQKKFYGVNSGHLATNSEQYVSQEAEPE